MSEKRFYWLKLKRDFFKRHDIRIIESMDNGKDYILFYLKLLCESVDHDGNLRFSDEIPYNEEMLATITNTNVDIVRSAVKIFAQLGMMEIMSDGTYYMSEVSRMIGSAVDSDTANRQRRCRERKREKERKNLPLLDDESDDEDPLDCDKMSRIVTKSNAGVTECVTKNNESKSKSKSKIKSKSNINNNIYNIYTSSDLNDVDDFCVDYPSENNSTSDYSSEQTRTKRTSVHSDIIVQVIDFLNETCGTKYKPSSQATKKHINARLNEGYTLDDFKTVITKKHEEWKDTEWAKFLRPETLFGSKFEAYLNQNIVKKPKKTTFGFKDNQRDTDMDDFERQLYRAQARG